MGRVKKSEANRRAELDPVSEEMIELEEARKKPVANQKETPWWTTAEVAKALKKPGKLIREVAEEMGIKTDFAPRKTVKWSFTDVLMVRREIQKKMKKRAPRDHAKAIADLVSMLAAHDTEE